MDYKILQQNEDGSVLVQMTSGDRVLNQNFTGKDEDELTANIKQGLAIFQESIEKPTYEKKDFSDIVSEKDDIVSVDIDEIAEIRESEQFVADNKRKEAEEPAEEKPENE